MEYCSRCLGHTLVFGVVYLPLLSNSCSIMNTISCPWKLATYLQMQPYVCSHPLSFYQANESILYLTSSPGPFPVFNAACNIEKLGMGLGTQLNAAALECWEWAWGQGYPLLLALVFVQKNHLENLLQAHHIWFTSLGCQRCLFGEFLLARKFLSLSLL